MKLIYGTLGWRSELLQPSISSEDNIDGLVIYYGYDKDPIHITTTLRTLDEMKDICKTFEIKAIARRIEDIYDFINITKQIKKDIKKDIKEGHNIAVFNISGSTKPMVSAALLVCIFLGVPAQYVNEDTHETIRLPLLQANYLGTLSKKERELAEFIIDNKEIKMSQVELAKKLGKEKSTINFQVKGLEKKGIVNLEDAEDGKSKYVVPSEGIELLF